MRNVGFAVLILLAFTPQVWSQVPTGTVQVDGRPLPGAGFIRQNGDVLLPIAAVGKAVGATLTVDTAGHFVVWNGQAHKLHGLVVGGIVYAPWYDVQTLLPGMQLDIGAASLSLHKPTAPTAVAPAGTVQPEDVLKELNMARTQPQEYARILEDRRQYYHEDGLLNLPGQGVHNTKEGKVALEDAILFLKRQSPLPPFTLSPGMTRAAIEFVAQVGPVGLYGNRGTDGSYPADRAARYGKPGGGVGEDINYGWSEARDIVIDLIVDDGVPDRGHRGDLFNPDFHVIGTAVGPNRVMRSMCVIDLVGDYQERP